MNDKCNSVHADNLIYTFKIWSFVIKSTQSYFFIYTRTADWQSVFMCKMHNKILKFIGSVYIITIITLGSDKCHCSFWIFVTRYKQHFFL